MKSYIKGFLGNTAVPLVKPTNELEMFLLCMSFKKYYQTLWVKENMTEEEMMEKMANMSDEKYTLDTEFEQTINGRGIISVLCADTSMQPVRPAFNGVLNRENLLKDQFCTDEVTAVQEKMKEFKHSISYELRPMMLSIPPTLLPSILGAHKVTLFERGKK
jgi:hypothetical protein